jgi:hypothetical protein
VLKEEKMKKIFAVLFAMVLVVSLTFEACAPTPQGPNTQLWDPDVDGEVTFFQLRWMASPEEVLYPNSNVGGVEFTFLAGAGDWLLDSHDGGYINVVIDTTAFGGSRQWAVRNLYLTYSSLDFLLGSTPRVMFSLGLHGEAAVESLLAAVFLSDEPLEQQPEAEELSAYTAWYIPYLVGGMDGGGSATWDLPVIIRAFEGSRAMPVRTESINITTNNVIAINETWGGCGPGAAARSIFYLGQNATTSPQDVYNDLYQSMGTNENGTLHADLLAGKNSYCEDNGLNITSELVFQDAVVNGTLSWEDLTQKVQDALHNNCDVEVYFGWRNATAENLTGHMAFVTSVTDYADGSAEIRYVDDPYQGDGKPQNVETVITTDRNGILTGGELFGMVYGFMIECLTGKG